VGWVRALRRAQAADQDVDHVFPVGGLEPVRPQRPGKLGRRERAVVGADQDAGDRR
jgi:hypothetical protein